MGSGSTQPEVSSLSGVLDAIDDQMAGDSEVQVRDIFDAFGSRAFGPLLVAPAIVAISPVGVIPGAPTVLAIVIILLAGQHAVGLDSPWVPRQLLDRGISADRWRTARQKLDPWVKRIDRIAQPRLRALTADPADHGLAVLACVAAALMVPLELIPFAAIAPGTAVLCIGLALIARDGALAVAGILLGGGSGYLAFVAIQ